MEHVKSGLLAVVIVSAFGLFGTRADAQESAQPAPDPAAPSTVAAPAPVAPPTVAPDGSQPAPAQPTASPLLDAPPPQPPPPPAPAPRRAAESSYDGPPLLLGRHTSVGGYGGVSTAYTNMLDRHGAVIGLEGALLLAHRLSIGLAGYGFSRAPAGPDAPDGGRRELGVGYGGLVVRYAFLTNFPIYPSVGVLIGGGATVLHDEDEDDFDDFHDEHDDDELVDGFFVAQPEVALHANLTRWMRLGVTAGYRITSSVHRFGLSESDLNGVTVGGNVQFGWL